MGSLGRKTFLAIIAFVFSLSSFAAYTPPTQAANGADFRANNIISDSIFFSQTQMGPSEIQAFLNAKVPTCDTNGTQDSGHGMTRAQWGAQNGYPAPYTCLKNYSQTVPSMPADSFCSGTVTGGTKSAAQILYDVSVACNVSPKVMLVLLQKEQSLITDDWPWPIQYTKATGYACPDSDLHPSVDANNNNCEDEFEGFFKQVYYGARQYQRYAKLPNQYNFAAGRHSYVAYQANNNSCGGTSFTMFNKATAGLYNYTPYQPNAAALSNLYGTGNSCSAYGNRNFWRMFTDWFGSTLASPPTSCNSKVAGVTCVWSLQKNDGSRFLTASITERNNAIANYGWSYEGIAFYASSASQTGTIPVYRLQPVTSGSYLLTADQSEYNSKRTSGSWTGEGVAFYAYPSTASTNATHTIYRLYKSSGNLRHLTTDAAYKQHLINEGFVLESSTFNSFSGAVKLTLPTAGRNNIYRLALSGGYFYTTNLKELELLNGVGYPYDGVLTTANAANTGTPIYRLQRANKYLYTASVQERDNATSKYGYSSEGIGFYVDSTSAEIYRLTNTFTNGYLYTSNLNEVMSAANRNGWMFEGSLVNKTTTPSPVYRFLNLFNHRHFYTIDIKEATRIANKGWQYETIAFHANKASGLPVYRMLSHDKHFYTTNVNEKNLAINQYGYKDEGVAFFVSSTATAKPAYRLQGGNDEYFYTASTAEKDKAVSTFGYRYEGIGFYLP